LPLLKFQPSYNGNPLTRDYHLFPGVKPNLGGHKFKEESEVVTVPRISHCYCYQFKTDSNTLLPS